MKITKTLFFFATVLALAIAGCRGGEFKEEVPPLETPEVNEAPEEAAQPVVKYTLSISLQGSAGGVTSEPLGIDCTEDCSWAFDAGTTVVLNPKEVLSTSKLKQWSENCSVPEGYSVTPGIVPPCAIVMDADKTVIATFELQPLYPTIEIDRFRDLRERVTPRWHFTP